MASKGTGLSEDWEDVADDTYSIISMPTSENEDELSSPDRASPAQNGATTRPLPEQAADEAAQPDQRQTSTSSVRLPSANKVPQDKGKSKAAEPPRQALGGGASETVANGQPEDPFKDPSDSRQSIVTAEGHEEEDEEGEDAEGVDELLDSQENNPNFLLKVVQSLRGILEDSIQCIRDMHFLEARNAERGLMVCNLIKGQIAELDPIVAGYAKIWNSSSREIPLDPGLHGWLSGVRVKLLNLQATLQDEARRTRSKDAAWGKRDINLEVKQIWENLEKWEKQMDDFIPIMQVDFNEFHTQQMSLPTYLPPKAAAPKPEPGLAMPSTPSAPIDIPSRPGRTSSNLPPPQPIDDLWLLRRELYNLKDEIQHTIKNLSRSSPTPAMAETVSETIKTYDSLSTTVSIILSNHGSDWIEHALAGGLTYAEFAEMDADSIRDFVGQIKQTWEVDTLMSYAGGDTQWTSIAEALRDRGQVALMEGQLDQLQTVAEILNAMLKTTRAPMGA